MRRDFAGKSVAPPLGGADVRDRDGEWRHGVEEQLLRHHTTSAD
jgi:hypothetical protein